MANELKLEQVITKVMINHIGAEGRHIGEGGCPRIQWYALRLEMIEAITAWNTRPAAPVEGLVRYNLNASFDGPGDAFCAAVKSKRGTFVRFDQAEAIIAAERAEKEAWKNASIELDRVQEAIEADNAAKVEQERLRFEGDLDKWMKIIGAGITGYQPEAYALMDLACEELVKLRADNAALTARVKELEKHVEELQGKNNAETCACSYDAAGDVCKGHSPAVEALETQLAAARKVIGDCLTELDRSQRPSFKWQLRARAIFDTALEASHGQ